jgi:hypothetical protein
MQEAIDWIRFLDRPLAGSSASTSVEALKIRIDGKKSARKTAGSRGTEQANDLPPLPPAALGGRPQSRLISLIVV